MNQQVVCTYVRIFEWKDPRFVFSKHQISEYTITHINDHNGAIDNRVAPLFRNVLSQANYNWRHVAFVSDR